MERFIDAPLHVVYLKQLSLLRYVRMQQKCSLFSFFLFTITYLLERSKFKFDDEEIFWFQYFYTSARHITRFLIITPSSNCREKAIKSFKSSLTEGGEFEAMMQVKKSIRKIIVEDRGKTFFNNSSRWIYFIFFYPIFLIFFFFFYEHFPRLMNFSEEKQKRLLDKIRSGITARYVRMRIQSL